MPKLTDLFPERNELPSTTYIVLTGRHRTYLAKLVAVLGGKGLLPPSAMTSRVIEQALDDFMQKYGEPV